MQATRKSSRKRAPKKYLYKALALYDFNTGREGEIKFKIGQIVYVLKEIDESWSEGYTDGKIGIFPSNFVSRDA